MPPSYKLWMHVEEISDDGEEMHDVEEVLPVQLTEFNELWQALAFGVIVWMTINRESIGTDNPAIDDWVDAADRLRQEVENNTYSE